MVNAFSSNSTMAMAATDRTESLVLESHSGWTVDCGLSVESLTLTSRTTVVRCTAVVHLSRSSGSGLCVEGLNIAGSHEWIGFLACCCFPRISAFPSQPLR